MFWDNVNRRNGMTADDFSQRLVMLDWDRLVDLDGGISGRVRPWVTAPLAIKPVCVAASCHPMSSCNGATADYFVAELSASSSAFALGLLFFRAGLLLAVTVSRAASNRRVRLRDSRVPMHGVDHQEQIRSARSAAAS